MDVPKESVACFMWDLSNFYEHIPRSKLWDHGMEQKISAAVLAVTLNQYSSRRFVTLHGLASDAGFPSRGIAAGCGFATYLVQMLSLPALRAFRARYPDVWLTMFIDDLMAQARHRLESQVVARLTEAGAGLADVIEHEWECKVATHKSVIVGSSDSLCKALREAFGTRAGQVQQSASNLGVDTFMGKTRTRRTTSTLQGRLTKLRRRGRKLRAIKEASVTPSVWSTFTKLGCSRTGILVVKWWGWTTRSSCRHNTTTYPSAAAPAALGTSTSRCACCPTRSGVRR